MATLRDIRKRINAVKNTKQITKAMKMVAAAKLRRAQNRMLEMRPYAEKMDEVISSLAHGSGDVHPLLVQRPRNTVEILVITSDRGLCGAFNSNILKAAEKHIEKWKADNFNISVSVVGRKANDYFKRRNVEIRQAWTGLSGKLEHSDVQTIAEDLIENYLNATMDEVYIFYNQFKTVLTQEVISARLLPVAAPEEPGEAATEAAAAFIYEPSQKKILNEILPKHIQTQIYRALLESQASEEAARMTAMENATQNADEMIRTLTLQFNKARQASITKELMDIVGGVEALKE
jgi:F-type H+-transporting ATPase subunit gamma